MRPTRNNNPFDGVGRGMKVAKEQIVRNGGGSRLAPEPDGRWHGYRIPQAADRISAHLRNIPTLKAEVMTPPLANHVPHLLLTYDQGRVKISPRDVMIELRKGNPSIELNPSTGNRRGGSAGLPGGVNTDRGSASGCFNPAKISLSPNGCMKSYAKRRRRKNSDCP